MDKIYIVTRRDLDPGFRASQCCHALRQFASEHPEVDRRWYADSRYLVLLEVPDKEAIAKLAYDATCRGIPMSMWQEPDLEHSPTALALAPSAGRILSRLPLAFRKPV